MLSLQTDINSDLDYELAQRFAYAIDHAQRPTARLRAAADILRSWDGVLHTSEAAPAIVTAARDALWPLLLEPKLGSDWKLYQWPESAYAEEQLITTRPAAWLPSNYGSWDELLAAAVTRGLDLHHAPSSLKSWRYGDEHTIELSHPLYGMIPLLRWTGISPKPQSGDTTTVKQVGHTFGPSQRFTMDWSDIDASTENIVMGQSGDPVSPWYRDQWPAWYGGTTFALPFTQAAVQAATKHTLRLVP
jgi:penicillin amidase